MKFLLSAAAKNRRQDKRREEECKRWGNKDEVILCDMKFV
jgi:hypothetical protein